MSRRRGARACSGLRGRGLPARVGRRLAGQGGAGRRGGQVAPGPSHLRSGSAVLEPRTACSSWCEGRMFFLPPTFGVPSSRRTPSSRHNLRIPDLRRSAPGSSWELLCTCGPRRRPVARSVSGAGSPLSPLFLSSLWPGRLPSGHPKLPEPATPPTPCSTQLPLFGPGEAQGAAPR